MAPTELNRQRRRAEMREMLATLHQQGIHVDGATLAAMARYIEGRVGLSHVADALLKAEPWSEARAAAAAGMDPKKHTG